MYVSIVLHGAACLSQFSSEVGTTDRVACKRLNMELDLQSYLHVHSYILLAETPQPPPPPHLGLYIWGRYWSAKMNDISLWPLIACLHSVPQGFAKSAAYIIRVSRLNGFIETYVKGVYAGAFGIMHGNAMMVHGWLPNGLQATCVWNHAPWQMARTQNHIKAHDVSACFDRTLVNQEGGLYFHRKNPTLSLPGSVCVSSDGIWWGEWYTVYSVWNSGASFLCEHMGFISCGQTWINHSF